MKASVEARPDPADLRAIAPAITILWHYDLGRVGKTAPLELGRTEVSRHTKPFDLVKDEAISRNPFFHVDHRDGTVLIKPAPSKTSVTVDGLPLVDARHIAPDQLQNGVIVVLGEAIVVCLHRLRTPVLRSPSTLGLVGNSDLIETVRRQILKVADLPVPVLIRGESGTGKELVARAIAAASATPEPCITVNMANVGPNTAASEFFGHVKGAFTGASETTSGHFVAADGGTLFLDELGALQIEPQNMLLRVLDDKEVLAVGAQRVRKVKVRVIAATDRDLETAVARGTFSSALLNRFDAGYLINLPPLAQRREDIGALFVHLLRAELHLTGELDRLEPRPVEARPWLYAKDFARIALAPFSGSNLRRLIALARRIVISSRGQPFVHLDAEFEKLVSVAELPPETEAPRRKGQPTDRQLKEALIRSGYNISASARELLINRETLYARARQAGLIRDVGELADDQVLEVYERHHGIIADMAVELRVAQQALQQRLRDILRRRR